MSENEKSPLEVTEEDLIGVSKERELEELPPSAGEKVEDINTDLKTEDGESYEYSDSENKPDPEAKSKEEENIESSEKLEDDDEEGEMDYSDIEFDARGVPILNSKDLENICYYSSFVGLDKKQMLDQIKSLYLDIDQYFKYHELPEEQKDDSLKEMYSKENFEATVKTLATFQREARSKTLNELENMNVTQVIENANVVQLWLTSLFLNHALDKDDKVLPKDLSFTEILANNNYYSIFLKEVDYLIEKQTMDASKELKRFFDLDFYSSIIGKFSSYFRMIFYHVGFTRVMYRVGAHTNKIQDSINSVIPEFYHRMTRFCFIHDENFKEKFKKIYNSDAENAISDKDLDERILAVQKVLENDQLYYELNNYPDDEKLLDKSCAIINRIYDLSEKFASDFKNKDKFIEMLKRIAEYLTEYIQTIYKKYKVNSLEELGKYIVTECNKYEEPPAKTMEKLEKDVENQLGTENKDEKQEVENALDELNKYQEEQLDESNKSQGERDKFTPIHYPILESVKFSLNLLKDIVDYINDSTNLKKANIILIQLIYNYFNHIVYKVIDSYGFYRRGSKDFFLRNIDIKKPLNELTLEEARKNEEAISGLTSAYQDELMGVMLEELSTAITVTEVCKTTEDMMSDIFEYYNTKEHADERDSIRIIGLTYQRNNIIDIRYQNMKTLLDIYSRAVDFIENIVSDNNYLDSYYSDIQKKLTEQAEYLQRRKNKKNKKRK